MHFAKTMKHAGMIKTGWLWLAFLVMSACATSVDVSQVDINNPAQELQNIKQNLVKARQEKVSVLSPYWFKSATEALEEAEKLQQSGESSGMLIKQIATAKQSLDRAWRYSKIARVEIAPAIEARDEAIKAQVPELYPSEFEIAEEEFEELANLVEQDEIASARSEAKNVMARFQKLEVRAIKEHKMGDARKMIRKAEKQGARKWVPTTLNIAKKKYAATDAYISKNPRGEEVQRRADDLLKATKHLIVALNQVKSWSKVTLEDIFLSIEDRVVAIEKLASGAMETMRTKDLDKHFHTIEENIKSRLESQKFLNEEVTRLQQQLKVAQKEMQDLSEVKRQRQEELKFQAKFQRVRELFAPNEADIYRQGSTLMIRLKGMNFEVGKSYILPEHFPLLNKVQKAIRIFETQRAVIEGHTDSTGRQAQNKVLSQQRADAVMSYLVNNGAIDNRNITAIGYGSDKPIAANTTEKGRRTNRRIDVVLLVDK